MVEFKIPTNEVIDSLNAQKQTYSSDPFLSDNSQWNNIGMKIP